jgi:PAS domain-containing protein
VPHAARTLRFEYALASFAAFRGTVYRTALDGFDSGWSEWTDDTWKEYSNLREGLYTFSVQARGADGRLARSAVFQFEILPPWYRTLWAYGIYALLTIATLGTGDRVRHRRIVKKERQRAQLRAAEDRVDEAQAETRAVEGWTQLILESALDGVVMTDEYGEITFWNPRAEQIFGWSAGEAIDVCSKISSSWGPVRNHGCPR